MVRKAETLRSLNELNMSKRAKTYLMSRFNSLNELIWFGRSMSYVHTCHPETVKKSKKSTLELINALDETGYIRWDINYGSFCIGRLYRIVFHDTIDAVAMPDCLDDFCTTIEKVSNSETIYHVDYRMGNEKYEDSENPTDEQLDAVRCSLQASLTEREYSVLAYRLGFEDGKPHSLLQTGRRLCISGMRVRQLEMEALKRLKNWNTLPKIVASSDEMKAEIVTIVEEIEKLKKDPIFKKEAELRQKLRKISEMPFECTKEVVKYLDGGNLDFSRIGRLGLSPHAFNCLKGKGINTIDGIIKFPKKDWPKVRGLGRYTMEEIEKKVRAAGYADFSMSTLS